MSGEESLAQVNREIEHAKLKNLGKAGLVIFLFLYSLFFTGLVSFFAVMIIPDGVRPNYFANLISGLAMNVVAPYTLRLIFQGFVVIVGALILSGAVKHRHRRCEWGARNRAEAQFRRSAVALRLNEAQLAAKKTAPRKRCRVELIQILGHRVLGFRHFHG
jgi:hypothetical protein